MVSAYADIVSSRADNVSRCIYRVSVHRDRMSDGSNQMSGNVYLVPEMLDYVWSDLWDLSRWRLYCYGRMSGDRCTGPHGYHKGLVSKSALTFGIKQKLIVKIETEPLR